MDVNTIQKVFPEYFKNFQMPEVAKEQEIEVYRACRTGKIEKDSFLNSFEENGYCISADGSIDDPQEYCLSTYYKLKDVKRFVVVDSKFQPPWLLAKGTTIKDAGVSCKTKEWKQTKGSHVDWWLYEGAEPWLAFEEKEYEEESKAVSAAK